MMPPAPYLSLLLSILTLVVALIALVDAARSHEAPSGWSYPLSCCSGVDCREVDRVREGRNGYAVPSNELIPYSDARIKPSPDGEFHWCTVGGADDGRTICLFVPPRGS